VSLAGGVSTDPFIEQFVILLDVLEGVVVGTV
jgi:hypothetical protein